ncbi:MAG: AmmeMemoRadiSam system protein A [Candidatus Omnitrophota bacterium]
MTECTLSQEEKVYLLDVARSTLELYLKEGEYPKMKTDNVALNEKRGAFVTLKEKGDLRGCIGRIVADMSLYEVVATVSVDAAINDPRFAAVTYDDLENIEIEISVLTPFEKIKSFDEIEVGTHGLLIRKGFYSGLLLPQVPGEYGWDKKTFLEHLCRKAGLPISAYMQKDTAIYKFSAIVFNESSFSK